MLKFCFRFLAIFGIFFSILPSWGENYKHGPSYIFEDHPSGKAPILRRSTRAVDLHLDGNNGGQCLDGRKLKAAIIDSSFNPEHTKLLAAKGVIHPDALKPLNPYIVSPNDTDKTPSLSDPQYLKKRERQTLKENYTKYGASNHGSAVMQALHDIAPDTQLLPIDLLLDIGDLKTSMAKSIRAAIAAGVDVINISQSFSYTNINTDFIDAVKEAVQRGIIIVKSAGNDCTSSLWKMWDSLLNFFTANKAKEVFDAVNGKGLLFVGSLKYNNNGQEEISDFSQLPDPDEIGNKPHFVFAPGEDVNLPIESKKNILASGTSFSAPTTAGAVLLLIKHARDKGYPVTSEDIINIIEESGRKITYKRRWPFKDVDYKSLDVSAARKLLDQRFSSRAVPVVQQPVPPLAPVYTPAPPPVYTYTPSSVYTYEPIPTPAFIPFTPFHPISKKEARKLIAAQKKADKNAKTQTKTKTPKAPKKTKVTKKQAKTKTPKAPKKTKVTKKQAKTKTPKAPKQTKKAKPKATKKPKKIKSSSQTVSKKRARKA